jgi:hypothetical protein
MRRQIAAVLVGCLAGGLALLLAACSGGGSPNASFIAPAITCDPLNGPPYKFTSEVTIEVLAATSPVPVPSDQNRPQQFRFTQTIDGQVRDLDKVSARISSVQSTAAFPSDTGSVSSAPIDVIVIGSDYYTSYAGQWTKSTVNPSSPNPVSYRPFTACKAIETLIDPTSAIGQPDKVNELQAHRYGVNLTGGTFFAQDQDFGGRSDAASFVKQLTGNIWLADDGAFIAKMDVTGSGTYPDGKTITASLKYEISDYNGGDITIQPPG